MTDQSRRDMLSLGALGAGAALAGTLLNPSVANAQNGGLPFRVGLVDIGVVFKNYKRKDDLEKEINARKDDYEKKGQEQQKVLEGIRNSMQLLKPDSDLYRQKKKQLNLELSKAKVERDGWEEDLKLQVENLTLMILDEIEDRVRKFGTDNKYDLIVKIDTKGWGDERFQERIFRAQVSSVLFFDPKLDVTSEVLKMLNDPAWITACQNRKPNQPSSQTPPPEKK